MAGKSKIDRPLQKPDHGYTLRTSTERRKPDQSSPPRDENQPQNTSVRIKGAWYDPTSLQVPSQVSSGRQVNAAKRRKNEPADAQPPPAKRMKPTRTKTDLPPTRLPNKRQKVNPSTSQKAVKPGRGKQRKQPTQELGASDDKFQEAALNQFNSSQVPKKSAQYAQITRLMPFLETMTTPVVEQVQYQATVPARRTARLPDAYFLNQEDATTLLSGSAEIHAPVFVSGGAREVFLAQNDVRPVEQVLDEWFLDGEENLNLLEVEQESKTERVIDINDMRTHFLAANGHHPFPWNLPDISNPRSSDCIPPFIQSPNCNLLNDIMRITLDVHNKHICPETCPDRKTATQCCDRGSHELTIPEFTDLQNSLRSWNGTLMLADAGAITHQHWDRWGFGTWISCYEGEIGFAWLSHPRTPAEHTAWYTSHHHHHHHQKKKKEQTASKPPGRWLFKVLRPSDAVYFPPGTVHVVFRLPQGRQTLAAAGHVLRRSTDWARWLRVLVLERETVLQRDGTEAGEDFANVFVPLVKTLRFLLDRKMGEREVGLFGGQERVRLARKLLGTLEGPVGELVGT